MSKQTTVYRIKQVQPDHWLALRETNVRKLCDTCNYNASPPFPRAHLVVADGAPLPLEISWVIQSGLIVCPEGDARLVHESIPEIMTRDAQFSQIIDSKLNPDARLQNLKGKQIWSNALATYELRCNLDFLKLCSNCGRYSLEYALASEMGRNGVEFRLGELFTDTGLVNVSGWGVFSLCTDRFLDLVLSLGIEDLLEFVPVGHLGIGDHTD